jgi:hypothetical protein
VLLSVFLGHGFGNDEFADEFDQLVKSVAIPIVDVAVAKASSASSL